MALQAGLCSCPRLGTRKVCYNHNAPSRAARVIVRPGVHNTAAAAGDVALAGELAAVEQLAGQQQLHHLASGQQHEQQQGHVLAQLDAAASNSIVQLHNVNHSTAHHSHWEDVQHSGFAEASSPQLKIQLLPNCLEQQQQQQLQRLESNGTGSTSYDSSSSSSSSSSQHASSRRKHSSTGTASRGGNTSSSDGNSSSSSGGGLHAALGGTHVHRPQQLHGSQDRHGTAGSSSSSGGVAGLQLMRPSGGPAVAGARSCSPGQLAALSAVFCTTVPEMQKLLDFHPQLASQQPAALQAAVQRLATALSIHYNAAAYMCYCYPVQLLLRPAEQVYESAVQLAEQLQLSSAAPVTAAAAAAPGLLARPQAGLLQRLQCLCTWFYVSQSAALLMVAAAPELLTDSAPSIQKRTQALGSIFRLQPVNVQRMVAAYPSVLFMSPRIMNNKLKVLMAIMHKDARIIGRDVVCKTPQLLRRNLENVRICYQLLPIVLQRTEGFGFALAAHNGRLLLLPAAKLLVRGARLQAALDIVPEWKQQWQQLRPPQVEQGFAGNYRRFERLEYLVSTQQASSIDLLSALQMPNAAFEQQYSSWGSWWQVKQQRLQQQQQQQQRQDHQGHHRYQQDRGPPQQQQQQQQHGPHLHPGSQQQQQLQLQYQQFVHQQLRRMQHLHRQRQLQLQQHRALVLQQRALQWQQLQKQKHMQQQHIMRLQQQRTAVHAQGAQLEHVAGMQQQPQHQALAEGGYLWGRHLQPSPHEQQQWQQQEQYAQEQQQQQQQHDWPFAVDEAEQDDTHAGDHLGDLEVAAVLKPKSRVQAGNAPTVVAAAAAAAESDKAVLEAEEPFHSVTHDDDEQPTAIQPQQQQQPPLLQHSSQLLRWHPSNSSRLTEVEDNLVRPQRQQQQQRVASYMFGRRATGNSRGSRLQQPGPPEQQQSQQQVWQPAAAQLGS